MNIIDWINVILIGIVTGQAIYIQKLRQRFDRVLHIASTLMALRGAVDPEYKQRLVAKMGEMDQAIRASKR